jgi:pilus assembly protein CpaB
MRSKAALLLSLVLGVVAVVLLFSWASSREKSLLQQSAMTDVLVATTDIPPNTILDERLVQRVQVPQKYLQPKALTDLSLASGRVAAAAIPAGAQVLGTYLEAEGRAALAYEVPRGRRAITVAVTAITGVGGNVRPGNFVDIFGTFNFGRPTGFQGGQLVYADEKTEVRILMQNVQVVAVERDFRKGGPPPRRYISPEDAAEAQKAQELEAAEARTKATSNVTMLLSPEQAQAIVLAQDLGDLTLALRSNLDAGEVVDIGAMDQLKLLGVNVPLKPRPRPAWREMRGGGF